MAGALLPFAFRNNAMPSSAASDARHTPKIWANRANLALIPGLRPQLPVSDPGVGDNRRQ
jgi:hypothetical protein